jgi:hypothetical protein
VISMDKYKTKKSTYSRKQYKQYGELMSINEVSPTNYSAVGSFMGHPRTAASEYQSKNIPRSESTDNFMPGRNKKQNVFRSHNNPIKDEEKRNRSLGIMSVDTALNFLQKRGDSPNK